MSYESNFFNKYLMLNKSKYKDFSLGNFSPKICFKLKCILLIHSSLLINLYLK